MGVRILWVQRSRALEFSCRQLWIAGRQEGPPDQHVQLRAFGQGVLHLVEEHSRQRRLLQFQIGQGKVVRYVKVGGQAQRRVQLVGRGLIVPLQKINPSARGGGGGQERGCLPYHLPP